MNWKLKILTLSQYFAITSCRGRKYPPRILEKIDDSKILNEELLDTRPPSTLPTSTTETWPKTSFSAFSSTSNSTIMTKVIEYRPKFTRIHGLWIVANRPVRPASNEVDISEEKPSKDIDVTTITAITTDPKTANLTTTGVALKIHEIKDEETQMVSAGKKQNDSYFGLNENFGSVQKPGPQNWVSMTSGGFGNFFPNYTSVLLIFIKLTQ